MKFSIRLRLCLLLIAIAFGLFASAQNPEPPKERPNDKIVRILAIGNSFSQDAIEQYFYRLAAADSIEVIVGNLYYGGCSLQQHWQFVVDDKPMYEYRKIEKGVKVNTPHMTLKEVLADESWDYVSFQQASHDSGLPSTYVPYLSKLMNYVKKGVRNDTKFMFHMTWAYAADSKHPGFKNYRNSQSAMYNAILSATQKALKLEKFDILIPCGTAIQNARTSKIGDKFCRDGYHLQLTYGRYTAACTWFEAIFKKSAIGNKFAPRGISEYQKKTAWTAAHNAVKYPFKITPVK